MLSADSPNWLDPAPSGAGPLEFIAEPPSAAAQSTNAAAADADAADGALVLASGVWLNLPSGQPGDGPSGQPGAGPSGQPGDGLPERFSTNLEIDGVTWTLQLEKHTVFGENTRFLVDNGQGGLTEIDRGVDRSYLGVVAGLPGYVVSAQLTEAGLMASIIRPGEASIVIEPTANGSAVGRAMHRVFVDGALGPHDAHEHGEAEASSDAPLTAAFTAPVESQPTSGLAAPEPEASNPPPAAAGSAALATLPPTRVLDVLEFEVGVEIGSRSFFSSTAYNGNLSAAQAAAASIAANLDARYLRAAGIKHTVGTVIIRTNASTDPLRDSIPSGTSTSGLAAFRDYWNSNPQEVGTSHDLAVYHVAASPSGLAYVNSVGSSNRYALSAGNGPTSWADGTLVHEFGHSWNLRHVGETNIFYESKPRNFSGSNSAGGSDVFVSVMHGGGDHNIGRLASDEATVVLQAKQAKQSFGTLVANPGPIAPFGQRDEAIAGAAPTTIDVIANDYDANNDVLDVRLLDTVSQQGAAISLSMGTGPGGRNEILYTAPTGGFSGNDFFHYTVVDSTGRTDWGAVYVVYNEAVVVDTTRTNYNYDFGTPSSPVLAGDWQRVSPITFGDISWSSAPGAVDRGGNVGANAANRDFVTSSTAVTLEHKIANGVWSVVLNMGDANADRDNMAVWAEGTLIAGDVDSPEGQFSYVGTGGGSPTPTSFQVTVTDGSLTMTFDDLGGVDPSWVLTRMSLNLVSRIPTLTLLVDPATGEALLTNASPQAISIDAYTLADTGSGLLSDSWFSLEDQRKDGGIWFEAAPTPGRLTELVGAAASGGFVPDELVYLGKIVNPQLMGDLAFQLLLAGESEPVDGEIVLTSLTIPELPGDYNRDLVVDSADYTIWRDNLGSTTASFAGADGNANGIIDSADYLLWRKNFGATAAPAATELAFDDLATSDDSATSDDLAASDNLASGSASLELASDDDAVGRGGDAPSAAPLTTSGSRYLPIGVDRAATYRRGPAEAPIAPSSSAPQSNSTRPGLLLHTLPPTNPTHLRPELHDSPETNGDESDEPLDSFFATLGASWTWINN